MYSKNYFNLTKISILQLFKMASNQKKCSRLEQRSVIIFLMAEKCKQCKIYRKMCDMCTKKHVLVKKNIYKWAKYEFATISWSWKNSPWSGNKLSGKEKVAGTVVSKGNADSDLGYKRTHHDWFQKVQLYTVFPIANSFGKFHFIYLMILVYECTHTHIYI